MFLYIVKVIDRYDTDRFLVVAADDKEAVEKVFNMCSWDNNVEFQSKKIDMVENYKIKLEKAEDNKNSNIVDLF